MTRYFYFQFLLMVFLSNFHIVKFQENYVSGNIIKNSGDTVTGFISFDQRVNTPSFISFKINENDNASEFKPSQIKEFCTKDDRYVSAFSEVLMSGTDIEKIGTAPSIKTRTDSIFLEILIRGHKSLFYNKSPEGQDNFYILHNNSYQLLAYNKYYRINNGARIFTENNRYLGQLGAYLSDCKKVQNYLHGVNYTRGSLKSLFLKYYECNPSELSYIKEEYQLFSQENFIKGYVINAQGDTLKGWVDYRNWTYNPAKIKFKESGKGSAVLGPSDILEFGVNNEKYVSTIADTEVSPLSLNALDKNPQLRIRISRLFLQVLMDGEKSLFVYKSANGKENFYIRQDSLLQLLIYKKYLKTINNADIVVENKTFTGQLNIYFANCKDLQKRISKLSYTRESLKRIFQEYYACINQEVLPNNSEKTILEKGILAGVSVADLKFKGSNYTSLNHTDFSPSSFFSAGLFLNAVFPKNKKRISLANELIYTRSEFHGESEEFDNAYQIIRTRTDIKLPVIKMNNLFRYKYTLKDMSYYLNIGLGSGFAIGSRIKQREDYLNKVQEWEIEHSKYELSYIVGSGFGYGKYNVDIRFERGSGFSFIPNLESKTNRLYLFLGYKF